MKILITFSIILFASTFAYSQDACPADKVCISPAAARQALVDSDTVKAQEKAIADLKDELNKMRVQFAEKSGENTALKQNAVSDRALIEILVKFARPKKIGLNLF